MLELKTVYDECLYQSARAVSDDEFGKDLEAHMSKLSELMYFKRGIGLSASQVGDLRQLFVVDLGYVTGKGYGTELIKMANAKILTYSEETWEAEEGCLSYPGLPAKVIRPKIITLEYFTPDGAKHVDDFDDWQARIIMHEMDHSIGQTLFSRSSSFKKKHYLKKLAGKKK